MKRRPTILRVTRGDTAPFVVPVTDRETGLPVDITGASIRFTAKHRRSDADVDAAFVRATGGQGVTITDPTGGLAEVRLTAGDTSAFTGPVTLYWDVQLVLAGETRTLDSGRLYVEPDVTRAAT